MRFFLAAEPGFEPRRTESESAVLPLHNSAVSFRTVSILPQLFPFVKGFFKLFLFFLEVGRLFAVFSIFSLPPCLKNARECGIILKKRGLS